MQKKIELKQLFNKEDEEMKSISRGSSKVISLKNSLLVLILKLPGAILLKTRC